ncbi:MAG: transposase [Candidatus Omnitrophota bacterium]
MPRQVRIVIPDEAHHITQRGNYQQKIFKEPKDFRQYLFWLEEYSKKYHIDILAYCLMNNHTHIIVIPHDKKSLGMVLNTLTMRYSQYVNRKRKQHGHVWQGRYFSCLLDETHLYRAIRYVERNPVRAKVVDNAWNYDWSSAPIHTEIPVKEFIALKDSLDMNAREWKTYLCEEDNVMVNEMRLKTKRGLVVGSEIFIKNAEKILNRSLKCLNPGRPKKKEEKGR